MKKNEKVQHFNLAFLEARVKQCFGNAKSLLEKGESISPVLILGKVGFGEAPRFLDMSTPEAKEKESRVVQATIRSLDPPPDYGITIMDAYMLRMENAKPEDVQKYREDYVAGSIAKDPRKVDVLIVVGMSVLGTYSITQPYRRHGKKIEYEEPIITSSGDLTLESALFGDVWLEIAKAGATVH